MHTTARSHQAKLMSGPWRIQGFLSLNCKFLPSFTRQKRHWFSSQNSTPGDFTIASFSNDFTFPWSSKSSLNSLHVQRSMITPFNKVLMDVHVLHNNVWTDLNNLWTPRNIFQGEKKWPRYSAMPVSTYSINNKAHWTGSYSETAKRKICKFKHGLY